jgi:hypothetical protein
MKTTTAIAFAAIMGTAHADLTFVQTLDIGIPMEDLADMTVRSKDDKFRADLGLDMTMILDSTSGIVITVLHDDRTFFSTQTDQRKDFVPEKPPVLVFTKGGKTEQINGADAAAWVAESDGAKFTLWMAAATPNTPEFLQEIAKIPEEMDPFQGVLTSSTLPEGLPVRLETIEPNGERTIITISKISTDPIAADLFQAPSAYKSLDTVPSTATP